MRTLVGITKEANRVGISNISTNLDVNTKSIEKNSMSRAPRIYIYKKKFDILDILKVEALVKQLGKGFILAQICLHLVLNVADAILDLLLAIRGLVKGTLGSVHI